MVKLVQRKKKEELHHELKSIAKSLVDVFVIMALVGETMGSVIHMLYKWYTML